MRHDEKLILISSGILLFVFGIVVVAWSIMAKARGQDIKSLWTRYLAWFLIAPPLVGALVAGKIPFLILMAILSLFCFREYAHAVGLWKDSRLMMTCYLAILCIYWPIVYDEYGIYQAMPIYVIAFILTFPIQRNEYENMTQKTCLAV